MSGASSPLSCPPGSSRFGVTLSLYFQSLGGRIQTQRSPQAVRSAKQCCLMSPLPYCSDSELICLLLIRHGAKMCPHCIHSSSCFGPAAPCSLHNHNTAVCYSMLPSNTLSYYVSPCLCLLLLHLLLLSFSLSLTLSSLSLLSATVLFPSIYVS